MVKYLNPGNQNPRRITKADKEFAKKLNFKNTKFPAKSREIHKIEKKNSINISVFGYANKERHPVYLCIKKVLCCEEKYVDLLLISEEGKRHYVLIKDFNTFMYDYNLHRGRKHCCQYCLQAFSSEEILKSHIKDCYKLMTNKKL